jgi:multicomponent K+:H+ antiporter subunit G
MTGAGDVPVWVAALTAAFLLLGAGLTLVGTIGLVRFDSFYRRVHAPTLGTTWGTGGILIASMIFFSAVQARPVLHEALIAVVVVVTTPVTLTLLVRAALYRDRAEGSSTVPPPGGPAEPHGRDRA